MFDLLKIQNLSNFHLKKRSAKKKHKKFIFFFKGRYFLMGASIDMNGGVLWETSVGFLENVVWQLFPNFSQSYVNLNVNSSPKFNGP